MRSWCRRESHSASAAARGDWFGRTCRAMSAEKTLRKRAAVGQTGRMCSRPIANTDQASSWDGPEGDYWRKNEARYNRMLRAYSERLLEAARLQPGERVLDVGCGCGDSSCAAARAASPGAVLGVDLSTGMLASARERAAAERLGNLRL